jgi:hypothetical protein
MPALHQLMGSQSEAKIKIAATESENRVVTTANSILGLFRELL